MHGPFDKTTKGEPNIYQSWSMKLFALPLLLAIALIGYIVSHPDIAKWVADGVQASLSVRTSCRTWRPRRGSPSRATRSAPLPHAERKRHAGTRLAPRSMVNSTSISAREWFMSD